MNFRELRRGRQPLQPPLPRSSQHYSRILLISLLTLLVTSTLLYYGTPSFPHSVSFQPQKPFPGENQRHRPFSTKKPLGLPFLLSSPLFRSQIQYGVEIVTPGKPSSSSADEFQNSSNVDADRDKISESTLFPHHENDVRKENPYISILLSCQHFRVNEITGHMRLGASSEGENGATEEEEETGLIDIVMDPLPISFSSSSSSLAAVSSSSSSSAAPGLAKREESDAAEDGQRQHQQGDMGEEDGSSQGNRYFNPTLIPLPASPLFTTKEQHGGKENGKPPNQYILLSRLVTEGLHQETHFCPAAFLRSPSAGNTYEKDTMISDEGGDIGRRKSIAKSNTTVTLRCTQPPRRLNIPPTPAFRCEGAWASFSDIPGFHDPRIFWSGKDEPLVIVNSGSAKEGGCVGLWIVDLRSIVKASVINEWIYGPRRHDQQGTNDVHDNDAQSQRELYKRHGAVESEHDRGNGDGKVPRDQSIHIPERRNTLAAARMSYPHLTELTKNPAWTRSAVEKNWVLFFPKREESWVTYNVLRHGDGYTEQPASVRNENEQKDSVADSVLERPTLHTSNTTENEALSVTTTRHLGNVDRDEINLNSLIYKRLENTAHLISPEPQFHRKRRVMELPMNRTAVSVKPDRTIAKLIGSGFTTSNLTDPFETPCFGETQLWDKLGQQGHWHQGSNSLRLVLCHQSGIRKARIDAASQGKREQECLLTDANEDDLVESGRVVHFMVMHRKFSNSFDLPMRYERFLMVWEARRPFRIVGVSKFPILFAGERAQPWSEEENFPEYRDNQTLSKAKREALLRKKKRWREAYFSYTPSLAWAWQGRDSMEEIGGRRNLGTGYLGNDVIVGIGMDDKRQGVVRVKVDELLSCLRLCPDFERANTAGKLD